MYSAQQDINDQVPSKITKGKYPIINDAVQANALPIKFGTIYNGLSFERTSAIFKIKGTSIKVTPMEPIMSLVVISIYINIKSGFIKYFTVSSHVLKGSVPNIICSPIKSPAPYFVLSSMR